MFALLAVESAGTGFLHSCGRRRQASTLVNGHGATSPSYGRRPRLFEKPAWKDCVRSMACGRSLAPDAFTPAGWRRQYENLEIRLHEKLMRLATFGAVFLFSAAAASAQDLPVFRIGVLNDQSGLYADIAGPGAVEAAKMAIEDFKPEAKGFRVEVLAGDHQNKPDIGAGIVRRWLDLDAVDAVADVPTSSVALAVSEVVRDKNKALLITSAGTSDLTGKACTPNNVHWTYDTWALANGTAKALIQQGGRSWFFLTADYAFGHALERDAAGVVKANGGEVLGHVLAPFQTYDFSSFLVQARASGAQVVALANSGGDTVNAVKQAGEFGLTRSGQRLASLLAFLSDVHAIGLETAQGLVQTNNFR